MAQLILVADDDPFNLKLLTEFCESAGYRVRTAADGNAVLDIVARERPDLVLLDVSMPIVDGFEVCRILKNDPDLRAIAVILVTALGDAQSRLRGIELGADDYVTKPFRLFELQQRIRTALRLREYHTNLEEAHDRIRQLEPKETPTRVGRFRELRLSLEYEFVRAARYGHALACVALALDDLSDIAVASGKTESERIVAAVADGVIRCVREVDLLFRFEEDSFVLLLPETDASGAEVVLRRLVQSHASGTLLPSDGAPPPRIVLGAAVFPAPGISTQDLLLRAAHDALARARRDGLAVATSWRG